MTPVFTSRGNRQHRYYVTRLKPGENSKTAWRVPAGDIDRAVLGCVERTLTRRSAEQFSEVVEEPMALDRYSVPEQHKALLENDVRVQIKQSEVIVTIGKGAEEHIQIPARLARRGNELKLAITSNDAVPGDPDPVLLKLITLAKLAQQSALMGEPDPIVCSYSKRHFWQLLRVSWLAPDITAAIAEGRQPAALTGRLLLRAAEVPLSWEQQRRYFGFS